jgi:hypothetical protein
VPGRHAMLDQPCPELGERAFTGVAPWAGHCGAGSR